MHSRMAAIRPGLRLGRQAITAARGLAAIGFRFPGLAVGQRALPGGLTRPAMLVKELRGILMHRCGLLVDDGRMFMRRDMPALMLLVPVIRFVHNPGLSPA
jgi:hypothetical protein